MIIVNDINCSIERLTLKKNYIIAYLRLQPLRSELDKLPENLGNYRELEQKLFTLKHEWNEYQKEIINAKNLGVNYDIESISNEIKSITEKIEKQPELQRKLKNNADYIQLTNKRTEIVNYINNNKVMKINDDDITNEATKLKILEAGLSVIKCPGCGKGLRYNFNKLELSEAPGSTNKDVEICKHRLSELKKNKILCETVEKYVNYLNDLDTNISKLIFETIDPASVLSPTELNKLQNRIQELKRIRILQPVNVNTNEIEDKIKNLKKRDELQIRISETERMLPKLTEEDKISLNLCGNLSHSEVNEIDKLIPKIIKFTTLINAKNEIAIQLRNISLNSEIESKLKIIEEEIPVIERKIQRLQNAKILSEQYKVLQEEASKLMTLYNKMIGYTKLKDKALQTELNMLTSVVECINSTLYELNKYFFEGSMIIRLQIFKELKNQNRIKPSVNLHIYYKGSEYDGINDGLSGGEADRISVCLLVALFKLSNCPILLLDESLRVRSDCKIKCIEGMKKILEGRPALCIEHDVVEGILMIDIYL